MKQDTPQIKYFNYNRKSTDDKERQILSLESQEGAMKDIADRFFTQNHRHIKGVKISARAE